MATSGTYGRETFDVARLIEHAYRRATGGMASLMSGEQVLAAQTNLALILSTFTAKGLNLWCIRREPIPVVVGQATYSLPEGTEDVLNVLWRYGTYTNADSLDSSTAALTYAEATKVVSAEVTLPADGAYSLVLERSEDGATWYSAGTLVLPAASAGEVAVIDADPTAVLSYWRVRETVGSITFTAGRFLSAATSIPAAPLNRDDYHNLPDRAATGLPLQYWFDKYWARPRLHVWQVPASDNGQLFVVVQGLPQDVGALRNQLAAPLRWHEAIISELAVRTYLELPAEMTNAKVTLADLRDIAKEKLFEAADSEIDGAPLRVVPNIRGYTR